ncbi:MAG: hypothetical protein QOE95_2484 [Gaiellaceae bacterium]|jgi:hypothetical protein|nr:hypothetical protein [Gaiellaceae bacterium]
MSIFRRKSAKSTETAPEHESWSPGAAVASAPDQDQPEQAPAVHKPGATRTGEQHLAAARGAMDDAAAKRRAAAEAADEDTPR